MATVDEAALASSPLASDLAAGVDAISSEQTVRFTKYVRLVLPLDGYVFWVKADIVSGGALFNASKFNAARFNDPTAVITPAPYVEAKGSLHYATEVRQDEDETYAVNQVVFTSETEVKDLNQVGPSAMFIATFDGVRFSFSRRRSFYRQAGLYHYVGNAIYADMDTQIIDDRDTLDSRSVIVSNSLPIWLAIGAYQPFYGFSCPIRLYPSFLTPTNLSPPFGVVHVDPAGTRALTGAPWLSSRSTHSQLATDHVRVTLWGVRNAVAQDFVDCVNQYSVDEDVLGIMNQPILRDEKRAQAELVAIAQKKVVEYDVSYHQVAVRDVARQLVESAIVDYVPTNFAA